MSDEVKNIIEETKAVDDSFDIFIKENDRFEVEVRWYKDNGKLFVKSVDEEYSEDGKNVKIMKISLKHPSEKDYSLISSAVNYKNMSDFTIQDIMVAEKVRVKTLIRSWTANKKISEIDDLDPSIMKGIVNAVREAIDMKGIF